MNGDNGIPRIGITPYKRDEEPFEQYIPQGYINGIERAGGEVVMIRLDTPLHTLLPLVASLDGMLFSGGPDVDPGNYGEARSPLCGPSRKERDQLELALLPILLARKVPILGICRGAQILNVGMGGTLCQDVPNRYGAEHQQPKGSGDFWHEVDIVPHTKLYRLMGKTKLMTDSYHHQCIKDLAPGLVASAYSQEGFIEAMEMPGDDYFFLATQWHPEITLDADEYSMRIFTAFLDAVRAAG